MAINVGSLLIQLINSPYAKKIYIEVGEKAFPKIINMLMKKLDGSDRNKEYKEICRLLDNPLKATRLELVQKKYLAAYYRHLTLKKSEMNHGLILIPVYGLYQFIKKDIIIGEIERKKWIKAEYELNELIKSRDLEEYKKLHRDINYESEYFSGFPNLIKQFEVYKKEGLEKVARLFAVLSVSGLDMSQSSKVMIVRMKAIDEQWQRSYNNYLLSLQLNNL